MNGGIGAQKRTFSDSFWTSDITSTVGIDTLIKRFKDGSKTLRETEDFLKQRAKCEDEYAKSLTKLAKQYPMSTLETGTISQALNVMRTSVEKIAAIHTDMSIHFSEHAAAVHQIHESHTNARKEKEEAVKKCHNAKKDLYHKVGQSQKEYHRKSGLYEQAFLCYSQEKGNQQQIKTQPKDVDKGRKVSVSPDVKLENKMHKAKEDKLRTNGIYKSYVDQLEQSRQLWESITEKACSDLQQAEMDRITLMRNELWMISNIDSQSCVHRDDENERIRSVVEKCDIEGDIQEFIKMKGMGNVRPAPIVYESFDAKRPPPGTLGPPPPIPGPQPVATRFHTGTSRVTGPDNDSMYASVN